MKNIILSIAVSLLIVGCATSPNSTRNELEFWTREAATIGTQEALIDNPYLRPKFEEAYSMLNMFLSTGNPTPTDLRLILTQLPVADLKSREARISIHFARIAFIRYGDTAVQLDSNEHVRIAMTAIRDGIKQGLGLL